MNTTERLRMILELIKGQDESNHDVLCYHLLGLGCDIKNKKEYPDLDKVLKDFV